MKFVRFIFIAFSIVLLAFSTTFAQKAEVTISLNEPFFDAALEALFQNGSALEIPISEGAKDSGCSETIRLQREVGGVRTAVRFRDGKILAPLAFTGNYNPPFIGCVPFSGWAESVIDLEFDQNAQRLVARARVLNVNLSGSGGLGGTMIAKLVQSSIDKKVNPIELFELSKLTFALPVKGATALQMKAVGIRHELQNGAINVVVNYEFTK